MICILQKKSHSKMESYKSNLIMEIQMNMTDIILTRQNMSDILALRGINIHKLLINTTLPLMELQNQLAEQIIILQSDKLFSNGMFPELQQFLEILRLQNGVGEDGTMLWNSTLQKLQQLILMNQLMRRLVICHL